MAKSDAKTKTGAQSVRAGVEEDATQFVLGRASMAKLLQVEGLSLTTAAEQILKEFDRQGLSDAERQDELLRRYRRAAR